ncbi:MAG: hypothetical protein IJN87_01300, partial [Firmicutes bacterium]|nr:hypothetical protein [Bacillota bacterium]
DYDKYPTTELGVAYKNILDCVDGQFAAYIEVDEDGTYTVNDYELSGGPQNEIYLTETNGALAIAGSDVAKQISLRSVDGNPVKFKVNNGDIITINHTTEMYYEVTENEDGYVIIQVESGFLGIGNLKLISGNATEQAVMTTSLTEDDYAMVATTMRLYAAAPEVPEIPAEPEVFEPEQIDIKMNAITLFRTKIVTVNITVSNDVSYVTINGEEADENILSRILNKHKNTKTYTFSEKMSSKEKGNYEIIAYNADGVPSITYTATR